MTNKEYKKIRGEYRPTVRAAFLEWKIYANSGFAETNRTLALYAEYWSRLNSAARALKCNFVQAAKILNII